MEVTHKIVFSVFGIGIRDTVVMTWIMMALISALVLILRRRMPAMIDWIFKMINGMVGGILEGDEISSYLPLLGSLFIFILCENLLSVIPGLTSPTADVNTTFALALVVFFAVHFYGIRRKGLWVYLKTFANPPLLFPLELLSHFSRTLALTLRLFGNILSGDMIVAITFSLVPLIVPIPMIALSMMSGVIQAFILTTLASLYISSAIEIEKDEEKIKNIELEEKTGKEKIHV